MPLKYTAFPPPKLQVEEYTHLHYKDATADKEYIVAILPAKKGYQIMGYYGRRGKAERISPGDACNSLLQARNIAQQLIRVKKSKGYRTIKAPTKKAVPVINVILRPETVQIIAF